MAKTVEQIATDLNLSVTTVRLVLSNKAQQYRISLKTQARINEHVERYGYTINHSARSLKLNKTDTLGLIIPCISNVFFATLAEKLELRCRKSGFQLMISCTYNDVDYENKLVTALIARNVDGLFITPSTLENQQHHLRQVKKPLVLLDRDFKFTDNALVESDNFAGAVMLTESMLKAGKTPLWFLVGDTALPSINDRLQGYLHALQQEYPGEPQWVEQTDENTPEGGAQLMKQLIARGGVPEAFIASSLPMLEGAIKALREHCGDIPHHINIGTFDEHPMLGFLSNNVWSMQQDEDTWAEKAFELMQQAIDGHPARRTEKVTMKLIKRSCNL
ncbi:LacI family transcriptional regulator [Serratia sp. S1B]|nr:LacI family transcriptional regulator [Serratia sp. S1B]